MVGVFTPQKLPESTNQGFSLSTHSPENPLLNVSMPPLLVFWSDSALCPSLEKGHVFFHHSPSKVSDSSSVHSSSCDSFRETRVCASGQSLSRCGTTNTLFNLSACFDFYICKIVMIKATSYPWGKCEA